MPNRAYECGFMYAARLDFYGDLGKPFLISQIVHERAVTFPVSAVNGCTSQLGIGGMIPLRQKMLDADPCFSGLTRRKL